MKNSTEPLDAADKSLLRRLQSDGRATNAQLAEAAHLSESACFRRVRALEARGVIAGYGAWVDQRAVGLPLNIFVSISLTSQAEEILTTFEKAIAEIPEVMECHLMTGTSDYLVRVVAADIDDLERLHAARLTRLPGVARVTSSVALRTVVRRSALPIR